MRVGCQQTIDDADLVCEEAAESNAEYTRSYREHIAKTGKAPARIGDGHGDCRSNQHHSSNGSEAEDEQVG